jgi:hypothetical protein
MSDAIIVGLASVILTPLITYLITQYWGGRPRLRATIYVHDISMPTFLQTYLKWDLATPSVEPETREKLAILSNLRSYNRLTLHNHGKEKTEPLTLEMTYRQFHYLVQLDKQPTLLLPTDGKLPIGYLRPNESLTLHIWSDDMVAHSTHVLLRDRFKITADRFYKLTFRFPLPLYLQDKVRNLVSISLFVLVVLVPVLNGLYWLYKIYITHSQGRT